MTATAAPGPEETLAALEEMAEMLAATDWAETATEVKLRVAARLPVVRAMLDASMVGLAGDLAQGKQVEQAGWASAKDFLTAATGGHKGEGPRLVKLARRLSGLPATGAALRAGWLSQAKAEVIGAKVASLPRDERLRARGETLLLELAHLLDATELSRSWPDVLAQLDPDGKVSEDEEALERTERVAHRERRAWFGTTKGGGAWFRVQSTAEDIALLKDTLLPLAAPVTSEPGACGGNPAGATHKEQSGTCRDFDCDHDGSDARERGTRMADALFEACRRLQGVDVLPESHGATPTLVVTTSLETLRGAVEAGYGGLLPDGDRLSAAAVRRLACDAKIIPLVLGTASQVLDEGRAKRLVTPALWTALVFRDRHCAFPGCRRLPIACDAHHVVSWADGGPTNLTNLVLVCRKHHTLLHTTPWQVRIDPADGRAEFRPPPGRDGPRDWIRERPRTLLVA